MPDEVFILAILSIFSVTALGFGLMRTISRHSERKWWGKDGLSAEQVVTELEERVDFAERLLSEGKRRDQLRAEP